MADTKISQLTGLAESVTADDLVAVVDDPSGTPVSRKATGRELRAAEYVTTEAGTAVTLAADEAGTVLECTSASAVAVTIPAYASVAIEAREWFKVRAAGAGGVTIAGDGTPTVNGATGNTVALAQYEEALLVPTATDVWVVVRLSTDRGYEPGGTDVAVADGGTGASSAAAARTNLDVPSTSEVTAEIDGDVATHAADTTAVHGITDTSALYEQGGTDVAVADGGTGASSAAAARTNLGFPVSGADSGAIHVATASEISAMTQKAVPTIADFLVIEDAAASNAKKYVLGKHTGYLAPVVLGWDDGAANQTGTTEVDCWDASISIPAATLAVGDVVYIEAWGAMYNNTGGDLWQRIYARIGGAAVFSSSNLDIVSNGYVLQPWTLRVWAFVASYGAAGTFNSFGENLRRNSNGVAYPAQATDFDRTSSAVNMTSALAVMVRSDRETNAPSTFYTACYGGFVAHYRGAGS